MPEFRLLDQVARIFIPLCRLQKGIIYFLGSLIWNVSTLFARTRRTYALPPALYAYAVQQIYVPTVLGSDSEIGHFRAISENIGIPREFQWGGGVEQSSKPANPKVGPCTSKLVSCLGRLSLNVFSYGIKRRVTVAHRLVQLYDVLLIVCFVHRSISALSAICRPFQHQCLFSFVVRITSCNITQSHAFMS